MKQPAKDTKEKRITDFAQIPRWTVGGLVLAIIGLGLMTEGCGRKQEA
jgi:hypothetical protein